MGIPENLGMVNCGNRHITLALRPGVVGSYACHGDGHLGGALLLRMPRTSQGSV